MSIKVDTRITPDIHPDIISAIDGYGDDTEPYVRNVVDALTGMYLAIQQVHDARASAALNPTWNEPKQIIETDRLAQDKISSVARSLDRANDDLGKKITYIQGELSVPLTDKAAQPISQEIRAHVKALSTDERFKFFDQRCAEGDEVTVAALLGAPPYLSGLTTELQAAYLEHWHRQQSPHLAKRLRVIQQARAKLQASGNRLFAEMDKAVGVYIEPGTQRRLTARQLRAATDESMKAFSASR